MNPERQNQITIGYRFKYIAIGVIIYVVVKQAWKVYQNNKSE